MGKFSKQLSNSEVIQIALEDAIAKENCNRHTIELAYADQSETECINNLLFEMSKGHNIIHEVSKWRWVLLHNLLRDIKMNPIDGLSALTDFWMMFDFPSESPHTPQALISGVSPRDYYSEENWLEQYSRHMKWLDDEKQKILKA